MPTLALTHSLSRLARAILDDGQAACLCPKLIELADAQQGLVDVIVVVVLVFAPDDSHTAKGGKRRGFDALINQEQSLAYLGSGGIGIIFQHPPCRPEIRRLTSCDHSLACSIPGVPARLAL